MKTYEMQFTGRKVGAIGKCYKIRAQVFADSQKKAVEKLYDRFEHITDATAKEISSPFDSDCLFDYANNTAELHNHIRHHVESLRRLIDRAAQELAKANKEWNDAPDAEDHGLWIAPDAEQFTREMRTLATLDLVGRHLDTINENERAQSARESEVANAKS